MCSSTHVDNKGKDILILGTGVKQGLGALTSEKCIQLILLIIEKNAV